MHRDVILIRFNPTVVSLVDYLAGARTYLDLVCDQSEAGMEIVTGTQAYSMRANWKLLVENSMDGYHARTTHQRYFDFLIETGADASQMRGGVVVWAKPWVMATQSSRASQRSDAPS